MRIVNQLNINDDIYVILKMDNLDREAITEHVGPLNGDWICYSGLMHIRPERIANKGELALFWAEVTPEITFATQREAELYAEVKYFKKAYAQIKYAVSLMNDTIARTDKGDYNTAINHKEEK